MAIPPWLYLVTPSAWTVTETLSNSHAGQSAPLNRNVMWIVRKQQATDGETLSTCPRDEAVASTPLFIKLADDFILLTRGSGGVLATFQSRCVCCRRYVASQPAHGQGREKADIQWLQLCAVQKVKSILVAKRAGRSYMLIGRLGHNCSLRRPNQQNTS